MTLFDDVKDYLKVLHDDEDDQIAALIAAVRMEIKGRSGKTKVAKDDGTTVDIATDELYCLAVKIGVTDAFENRGSDAIGKTVAQYSRSFNKMVEFIGMCGDYK